MMDSITGIFFKEHPARFYLKLLTLLGTFVPGFIFIYYLKPNLFFGLDTIKLTLLSIIASLPWVLLTILALGLVLILKVKLREARSKREETPSLDEINDVFLYAGMLLVGNVVTYILLFRYRSPLNHNFITAYVVVTAMLVSLIFIIILVQNAKGMQRYLIRTWHASIALLRRRSTH